MRAEFTLPRLGETMETGRVAVWLKQPGDRFRRGETIVEIESDKTVVEMPALADGVLAEILVAAGQDAAVGDVLCRYDDGLDGDEPAREAATVPPDRPTGHETPPPAAAGRSAGAERPPPPAAGSETTARLRATPLARRLATRNDVAIADVSGTGPRGRVEASDVRAAIGDGGERAPPRPLSSPTPSLAKPRGDADGGAAPAGEAASVDDMVVSDARIGRRDWSPHTTGARVVLVHGLAADVQSWASLAGMLARAGRRVTAFDLPGHGATTRAATDIDDAAAAVAACLDALGDEPVDLVGHSVGGAVAVRVARSRPDLVFRLTLIAPAGLDRQIDVGFVRGIAGVRTAGALPHLLRRLAVTPQPMSGAQLDALASELGRGRLRSFVETLVDDEGQQIDVTADLRALPMPARIVWGLEDRIIPWTQVREAGSRCAVHLVADAGHVPHWDKPAEIAALFD